MNEIENKTKAAGEVKVTGKRRYLSAQKKYHLDFARKPMIFG